MPRAFPRLGCFGSIVFLFLLTAALYALFVPWAFHVGGRWTPTTEWEGVGRLRDSTGQEYGLYASFFPDLRRTGGSRIGPARAFPRSSLRGRAWVCTPQGMRIPFDVRGDIYGAWLDSEGKQIDLSLAERTNQKPRRHFTLQGSFRGPELPMDDRKSMFMYLQSDGRLTPARSYTSPVPERHATVTLEWGTEADFDQLCRQLIR